MTFTHCPTCNVRWQCVNSSPNGTRRLRQYKCPCCGALKHTQETEITRGKRRITTENEQWNP